MERFTMGSLKPFSSANTGLRKDGLNCSHSFIFFYQSREAYKSANHLVMPLLYKSGARLMASVPPASTKSWRPEAMSLAALSSACKPEAQFLCTVQAGTD